MMMVTSDNAAQAKAVTDHLIQQGCRRILFLGGKPNTTVHQAREQGYLRGAAPPRDPSPTSPNRPRRLSQQKAHDAVINAWKEAPFDAVFAASDLMAMGAITPWPSSGSKFPGTSRSPALTTGHSAPHNPALTTVRQDPVAMGRAAVDALKGLGSERR